MSSTARALQQRVLVAEADSKANQLLSLILRNAGWEVVIVEDGFQVLQRLTDGSSWTAAVIDDRLDGVSGLDLLEELKRAPWISELPILVSSNKISLKKLRAVWAGPVDRVKRPVHMMEVEERLLRLMGEELEEEGGA